MGKSVGCGFWKNAAACVILPDLVEGVQLLLGDGDLRSDLFELDLKVFEVDLVAVAELLRGRHAGVQALDAVLGLVDPGL